MRITQRRTTSLLLTMLASLVTVLLTASPALAAGLEVANVSQQDIIEYASENNIDLDALTSAPVTYKTQPNYATQPYAAGELSESTANDALAVVNFARYVAGLSADVTLDSSYSELAQAASLVNQLNGSLTHTPSQPAGISDELYQLGKKGAGSSNIAMGYLNPVHSVLGYLGDTSSITTVGHRRWILNPSMAKTGFGQVGRYSAMYAFDGSRWPTEYNVAWPAQNMPVELFSGVDPWSLSTGTRLDESAVSVTLTRKSDGRTWKFGAAGSDGVFYVNNGGYGQTGCIIFRPAADDYYGFFLSYSPGDSFHVVVEGVRSGTVEYDVNFFDLGAKKSQTITCQDSYTVALGDPDFSLNASALGGALLSYSSSNDDVVSVSANGTVSIRGVGTATITISAGQTSEYFPASKSVTVVVERRDDGYLGFPDVRGDEWFATDRVLGYAVGHGLIMGYDDGRFAPYEPVTRAQAVTVLWRMAGKPDVSSKPFDDVPAGEYYAKAVAWARATGVTSGYDGTNRFGPDDELTREMLAAFAASYARLQGLSTSGHQGELGIFSDAGDVSAWARSSMGWCVHEGIFSGVGGTTQIAPQGVADRSQLAKIVTVLHRDVLHLASDDEYTTEKNRQSALAANPSVIRSVPDTQNSEVVTLTGTVRRTFADYYFMGSPYPIYYLELPAEVTVTGTQYGSISGAKLILPDGFESYVGKTVSVRTQASIRPTASIPEAQFTMLWCFNTTFQRVF